MKIALIGYGKMGKEIEQVTLAMNHEIVLKISTGNYSELTIENLKKADVAIEFSTPKTAVANILKCFEASIPVVVGTTGWLDRLEQIKALCEQNNQAFFYASNFSVGVNLFFQLNEYLAGMMKSYPEFVPSMEEIHHIHKKDAPSGTAITLAQGLMQAHNGPEKWVLGESGNPNELVIHSKREGEVPGTHSVSYTSKVDQITISHEAYSRKGFAEGAVHAALWLVGKKGVFGMKDMLKIR
jgi:4-hydroxy-tetrahydrodipicolinate reductase